VPVGLTRFHHGGCRPLTARDARDALGLAEALMPALRAETHKTWLYPADELYLLAGKPFPPASFYDEPAQRDNGVGLVRLLLDDWNRCQARRRPRRRFKGQITLVCGVSISATLDALAAQLGERIGATVSVMPIANRFFGETVTVSGLLTAQDLYAQLPPDAGGDLLILPRVMFDASGERTLDDVTLDAIATHYGRPVRVASLLSDVLALL